jgi:hypothetical protein
LQALSESLHLRFIFVQQHLTVTFRLNRYSMPVNSSRQPQRLSMGNSMQSNGLGPLNTTSFLFDDNDDKHLSLNGTSDLTSPIANAFMQLGGDDKFPTLRSHGTSGIVRSAPCAHFRFTDICLSFLQTQLLLTWPIRELLILGLNPGLLAQSIDRLIKACPRPN